jgi:choline dehydrogenase
MPVPRGKMLGGSSSLNAMAYVRGHPGDYDAWAAGGATGWSYAEVLPYFRKSEGFVPSDDIAIDEAAHGTDGPLGVSVRAPVQEAAAGFVAAAAAVGIPRGDYNGRDRGGAAGVASLFQTTTRRGRRSDTYRAFLEGDAEQRANLTILTGAHATRVIVEDAAGSLAATGVEYRAADGASHIATARQEVILCAGAVGSPHLLMLSGIGPRDELERAGLRCLLDLPAVGKHLKDHVQTPLFYPAPGIGVSAREVAISMGAAALRATVGPWPADDTDLTPDQRALLQEAEGRRAAWEETGRGLIASCLYDAGAWYSTGLGDAHSHDAQISCVAGGGSLVSWRRNWSFHTDLYFDDAETALAPDAENIVLVANPVLPRSEGEIVLASSDPAEPPVIRMNYFSDPHDMKVMVAVMRRTMEIAAHWPGNRKPGPLMMPPFLARRHGHVAGEPPSDALLEDFARHFAKTVFHLACTCRMGSVVDPDLRVRGVARLRVADASVMPDLVSGNTNAPVIMIGEKAAELVARTHGVRLASFVGN